MTVIAFPLGDGCPDSGRLVDAEATNPGGLVCCSTCGRWACTQPTTTDGSVRQVERHHRRGSDAVSVRTVAASPDPLAFLVRVPRDGRLTRDELRELSAQALGCLAAGHPLDHDFDHPVDAGGEW